jgi:hypothetical protein
MLNVYMLDVVAPRKTVCPLAFWFQDYIFYSSQTFVIQTPTPTPTPHRHPILAPPPWLGSAHILPLPPALSPLCLTPAFTLSLPCHCSASSKTLTTSCLLLSYLVSLLLSRPYSSISTLLLIWLHSPLPFCFFTPTWALQPLHFVHLEPTSTLLPHWSCLRPPACILLPSPFS